MSLSRHSIISIIRGQTKSLRICQLFDLNADRYFGSSGLRPEDIEWVWIVEERRRAEPEEIRRLCEFRSK